MYKLIRKLLFTLHPEQSHVITLKMLKIAYQLGALRFYKMPPRPCQVMGLTFPNPIGLAAGLDKNGDYIDALAALGFGFIEIGTVTPKPQPGNPKPRLFRLIQQEALINRMGFNNKGVAHMVHQLKKTKYQGILGINIGKNSTTPIENAIADYIFCFRHLAFFASYITINISSPNTAELRALQQKEYLAPLLQALKKEQQIFFADRKKYVPLVVKISPDLSDQELYELANILLQEKIDGVIATNTTITRETIKAPDDQEKGGLSGRPLASLSTKIIKKLNENLQNKIPIIASGGVMDEKTAKEKIQAGASLLQLYTGLIYQGPGLIRRLIDHVS